MLAITGKISSGKDTIADYLVATHDYTKYSFSSPLKKAIQNIFHFSDEQLWGSEKEKEDLWWGYSPRKIMQVCGTELFRDTLQIYLPNISKDLWILSFKAQEQEDINYVIPDLRFENEAKLIRERNGLIVRVKRNKELNLNHSSEQSNFIPDIEINNNGSLAELYWQIESIIVPKLPQRSWKASFKYLWFWHKSELATILASSFLIYSLRQIK